MRWLLFLSLFFSLPLLGEAPEYEAQDVATNEGLPSSIVAGSVCAITGEYCDSATDAVVVGPEPLVVSRQYGSFSMATFMGKGWSFSDIDTVNYKSRHLEDGQAHILSLRQLSGACVDFSYPISGEMKKRKVEFEMIVPKGLTNGASYLSGKTNIKNLRLVSDYANGQYSQNKQKDFI